MNDRGVSGGLGAEDPRNNGLAMVHEGVSLVMKNHRMGGYLYRCPESLKEGSAFWNIVGVTS